MRFSFSRKLNRLENRIGTGARIYFWFFSELDFLGHTKDKRTFKWVQKSRSGALIIVPDLLLRILSRYVLNFGQFSSWLQRCWRRKNVRDIISICSRTESLGHQHLKNIVNILISSSRLSWPIFTILVHTGNSLKLS